MQYTAPSIAPFIPEQFPQLYREDGKLFVEFTKAYYEFLDLQNTRNFSEICDIDTTFNEFLIFYKKKYLKDLPFVNSNYQDLRFVVKHIADLYTRKGTPDSLQLLFKMFFQEEVELFFPGNQILRISDSKWTSTKFIEFKSISNVTTFPLSKGDVIRGDTSKAYAYLDDVVFYNINGAITPIGYVSNVYGTFISDDGIIADRDGEIFYPGNLIYGSIQGTTILREGSKPGNAVGDRLFLQSDNFGVEGTAVVDEVSLKPSGIIEWRIRDDGFGYSTDKTQNEIIISTQVLVLNGNTAFDIEPFDTITAVSEPIFSEDEENPLSLAESDRVFSGTGMVVAYEHPTVYLDTVVPNVANPAAGAFVAIANTNFVPFPDAGAVNVTVNKHDSEQTFQVQCNVAAERNDTALFELGSFTNRETIQLIPDIVGDFINVPLNSQNYGMSGPGLENIDTKLKDAFRVDEYEIGSISRLRVLDTGTNYVNNVRVIATFDKVASYDFRDIGLLFDRGDFIISPGDVMQQTILIEDLTYNTDIYPTGFRPYISKVEFLRRDGDVFYFRPITFFQPRPGPLEFRGRDLEITFVLEDADSPPMGDNASIQGDSELLIGQIRKIKVLQSGFKYRDLEKVALVNQESGETVAFAELDVGGMGETDGQWITTSGHLNDPGKFIPDNNYYQDYSYEISSLLNPDRYEQIVKDTVHVAGTKMFSSPLINTINDVQVNADVAIENYTFAELPLRVEQENANGVSILTEQGEIINAVIVNFDSTSGLELPFIDGSIPIVAGQDYNLDTWDEDLLTMDNAQTTFDREP
jgi:hypothetical protein